MCRLVVWVPVIGSTVLMNSHLANIPSLAPPQPPPQELHITALLFGSLVAHQLVSSITLGIALRYVLDALRKPPGSKMFAFGADALKQFAPIVHMWPQFCAHVLQVRGGACSVCVC